MYLWLQLRIQQKIVTKVWPIKLRMISILFIEKSKMFSIFQSFQPISWHFMFVVHLFKTTANSMQFNKSKKYQTLKFKNVLKLSEHYFISKKHCTFFYVSKRK